MPAWILQVVVVVVEVGRRRWDGGLDVVVEMVAAAEVAATGGARRECHGTVEGYTGCTCSGTRCSTWLTAYR